MRKTKKELQEEVARLERELHKCEGLREKVRKFEELYLCAEKELKHSKTGWEIHLNAQTLTMKDFSEAQKKVKQLIDMGFWFMQLEHK